MFSPSLISMMLHSLGPDLRFSLAPPGKSSSTYKTIKDVAASFQIVANQPGIEWPEIPVVGWTTRQKSELDEWFQSSVISAPREAGDLYFWGRIPLNILLQFFSQFCDALPGGEYIDLGTPVREAGSLSVYDNRCANLLPHTPRNAKSAKVGAAIVDMGKVSAKSPDDYGGRLRHVVTTGIELSDHAEQVLSVLLERLQSKGVLADTTVSCALVRPTVAQIGAGRSCFEQAGTAEILDALKALEPQLTSDGLPVAINMSLGTHVGPHNGESPLEGYIANTIVTKDRFVVVAAGNEGGTGHTAKCSLTANEEDLLSVHTGQFCEELLIEFWWDDSGTADLSIKADIWEARPGNARVNLGAYTIDSSFAATLSTIPVGLQPYMATQSLFSAKCRNNFSCIAFAISSVTPRVALPQLQIRFTLKAVRDIVVNAWIVVAEQNPLSTFVAGGQDGTIMVPASDPSTLSVAGLRTSGQMWEGSSRGPAAQYDPAAVVRASPLMAHLASLGTDFGTSYASPRACADATATLADPIKQPKCIDAESLLSQTYGLSTLSQWNPRSGYHKQTI
jgi:hypothetical protein